VWCKNLDRFFFRFVIDHACDGRTDRQTDRQTEFSSLYRVCITCSAVKKREKETHGEKSHSTTSIYLTTELLYETSTVSDYVQTHHVSGHR